MSPSWKSVLYPLCISFALSAQGKLSDMAILRQAGLYAPGFGMMERPEYSVEFSGLTSVMLHSRLAILDAATGRAREIREAPKLPESATGLKFRVGHFWACLSGAAVLEYLPEQRAWTPRLLAAGSFKDYEVTFDGRILLIGTAEHLVEFHQPMSVKAEAALPYPAMDGLPAGRDVAGDPRFFWVNPICARVDEYLLIYFSNIGRLYKVDILKNEMDEISVPWARLDPHAAAREVEERGFLSVTGRPPVNGIEFIPETSTRIRVLYEVSDAIYAEKPPLEAGGPKRLVEERPSTERGLHWFSLDLNDGNRTKIFDEPDLSLPIALDGQGNWMPVDMLFEMKAPEGVPSAKSR